MDYFPSESAAVKEKGKKSYLDAFAEAKSLLKTKQKRYEDVY